MPSALSRSMLQTASKRPAWGAHSHLPTVRPVRRGQSSCANGGAASGRRPRRARALPQTLPAQQTGQLPPSPPPSAAAVRSRTMAVIARVPRACAPWFSQVRHPAPLTIAREFPHVLNSVAGTDVAPILDGSRLLRSTAAQGERRRPKWIQCYLPGGGSLPPSLSSPPARPTPTLPAALCGRSWCRLPPRLRRAPPQRPQV